MPVQHTVRHTHGGRGDVSMSEQKYAATYKLGKTTVHVVAPPPMTEEEKEEILRRFHEAGWAILERMAARDEKRRREGQSSG